MLSGLAGIAFHLRNRQKQTALFLLGIDHVVSQQGGQAFAQPFWVVGHC